MPSDIIVLIIWLLGLLKIYRGLMAINGFVDRLAKTILTAFDPETFAAAQIKFNLTSGCD